jgi:hypothetical protein
LEDFFLYFDFLVVSHTTDDMIFQWDPDVPLVVDENIELPQLQLVRNRTDDCSQVYSTGEFTLTSSLLYRQVYFNVNVVRKLHDV